MSEHAELPWRGPGADRPGLRLPPGRMPLRRNGRWLKRWRYVVAFSEQVVACAARVQVGPAGQTFWAILPRDGSGLRERTRLRLPGARGEVWTERETTKMVRIGAGDPERLVRIESPGARGFLRVGDGRWVEAICPTGEDGNYVWTRKRADVPVGIDLRFEDRWIEAEGRGVEDESAGYHPHHTVWSWSAGTGRSTDGRSVGWSLVAGINDPPQRSERAIWIDGEPFEPGPVTFDGTEAVGFEDGSRLELAAEGERRRAEDLRLVRYEYVQPLGAFTGTLPGGIRLERALGAIERHDALW